MALTPQQQFAKDCVSEHLIKGQPFKKQLKEKIDLIIDLMNQKFPVLLDYEKNWAAIDFIYGCTKNCLRQRK
ncbi:hypothetical protein BDQ17DRAFT_1429109 [Cyathus striatus]|nr:hypothetical protein BDQ17DRAFT_1429109 [Cyathus striatus]